MKTLSLRTLYEDVVRWYIAKRTLVSERLLAMLGAGAAEADLGMFSMFGRTGAPKNGAPT